MNGKVIAVVGAGGKTTLIRRLAQKYRTEGRRVFVTTTTHMMAERGTLLDPAADEVAGELEREGYCMAGSSVPGTEKIGPLSEAAYRAGCEAADLILVEADGSAHHLLKYPADYEPVIPENTEEIIVVMGADAAGMKVRDAVHRYELACEYLGLSPDDAVTDDMILRLAGEGYSKPLHQRYPSMRIITVLSRRGEQKREYEIYEEH